MNLLIAGDLVPMESNAELFKKADIKELLGNELKKVWDEADIRILNLETPLTDEETPILKCGPNLLAPKETIYGIKALRPTLIGLANNHIMDQGVQGYCSTIDVLENASIPYVGTGKTLNEAKIPYIIEKSSERIGIYACAEHEFSIAEANKAGANPFDPLESLDHIFELSQKCDYTIVLYHGGKEHYRYPSPYLQKVCHKIVEKGADLVVCQHSHCIGCEENYLKGKIIYGQGNFIFDDSENEFWQTSLIVNCEVDKKSIDYIPIVKNGNKVKLANQKEKEVILNQFNQRTSEIKENEFIEEAYRKFADSMIEYYLRSLTASGKTFSRIDHHIFKGALIKKKYTKEKILAIKNFFNCETHREMVLNAIKKMEI